MYIVNCLHEIKWKYQNEVIKTNKLTPILRGDRCAVVGVVIGKW
jgi:hypothetical protein